MLLIPFIDDSQTGQSQPGIDFVDEVCFGGDGSDEAAGADDQRDYGGVWGKLSG